jgi:hypothetical protein
MKLGFCLHSWNEGLDKYENRCYDIIDRRKEKKKKHPLRQGRE